jgi:hypothetical protein
MTSAVTRIERRLFRAEEPEWIVWALVAIMLVIGLIARVLVVGGTERISEGNMTLRYPSEWVAQPGADPAELVHVGEALETSLFPTNVRVLQMPVTDVSTTAQTLGDLALKWSSQQAQDLLNYKVFNMEPATVRGKEAVKIDYAYVTEPPLGGAQSVPVVARAQDVLLRNGDTVTIASFVADATVYDQKAAVWERILASLDWK